MSWFREFEQEYGKQRLLFLNHQAARNDDALADFRGELGEISREHVTDYYGIDRFL